MVINVPVSVYHGQANFSPGIPKAMTATIASEVVIPMMIGCDGDCFFHSDHTIAPSRAPLVMLLSLKASVMAESVP